MITQAEFQKLKDNGFEEEVCPVCNADKADTCKLCDDEGYFHQKIDEDWELPEVPEGSHLFAFLDVDHWAYVGIIDEEENSTDIPFPFKGTGYADFEHMRALGFEVES